MREWGQRTNIPVLLPHPVGFLWNPLWDNLRHSCPLSSKTIRAWMAGWVDDANHMWNKGQQSGGLGTRMRPGMFHRCFKSCWRESLVREVTALHQVFAADELGRNSAAQWGHSLQSPPQVSTPAKAQSTVSPGKGTGSGEGQLWVPVQAQPFRNCVMFGKLFNLSGT